MRGIVLFVASAWSWEWLGYFSVICECFTQKTTTQKSYAFASKIYNFFPSVCDKFWIIFGWRNVFTVNSRPPVMKMFFLFSFLWMLYEEVVYWFVGRKLRTPNDTAPLPPHTYIPNLIFFPFKQKTVPLSSRVYGRMLDTLTSQTVWILRCTVYPLFSSLKVSETLRN